MKVYLDNAATTKPYEEVLTYINQVQEETYGNPSSAHSMGMEAEKILKQAGEIIAGIINTKRDNLIFTSGGTEADNMALMQPFSDMRKIPGRGVIISSVEHPAVDEPCGYLGRNGVELTRLPVNSHGMIDPDMLRSKISEKIAIISVMYVNNEVGTIQPISDICTIKAEAAEQKNKDLFLHTDAVQAFGKIPIDMGSKELYPIDLMSLSAHKIHGPKGTGALYTRSPEKTKPLLRGGGQQRGFRSGTEDVAGIAGFGCAAGIHHANSEENIKKIAGLRKILMEGFIDEIDDIRINSPVEASLTGEAGKCIPNILSVSFLGTRGEVILHSLEQVGIFVSTQSACSSKKKGNSYVLTAMGLSPDEIEGTIRFSMSAFNTEEEIHYTIAETKKAVEKFRKLTGYRKK